MVDYITALISHIGTINKLVTPYHWHLARYCHNIRQQTLLPRYIRPIMFMVPVVFTKNNGMDFGAGGYADYHSINPTSALHWHMAILAA